MRCLVSLLLLLSSAFLSSSKHVELPPPYSDDCILEDGKNLYDPADANRVPWFTIDLDQPPELRWKEIATVYKAQIGELLDVIKGLISPIFPDAIAIVDRLFGEMNNKIAEPYRTELASIANYSGIPLGEIVLYNVFYEVFTVCTSIIAQDYDGKLYHARNLDFGLFLGWNATTHEWMVSSVLRKMVVNINWMKGGKLLYKSNNFAGFVGAYNGLKPGAFVVTANERFMLAGGWLGILEWALDITPNSKWMTWLTRETLEEAVDFADAKNRLMNTPMLSPVYYILSGPKPYEGAIITRSLNKTDILTEMSPNTENGWYLLQTNYDPSTEPLFLDDRQTPGDKCMRYMTRRNVGFKGIYNVLSSRTNLNKLTAYTVLMQVDSGDFETHLQSCPGECWPF